MLSAEIANLRRELKKETQLKKNLQDKVTQSSDQIVKLEEETQTLRNSLDGEEKKVADSAHLKESIKKLEEEKEELRGKILELVEKNRTLLEIKKLQEENAILAAESYRQHKRNMEEADIRGMGRHEGREFTDEGPAPQLKATRHDYPYYSEEVRHPPFPPVAPYHGAYHGGGDWPL